MSRSLRCPKCSCPLDVAPLPDGVSVESCPHCFGAFYDAAELAIAIELSGAAETHWLCPKCGERLRTGRYRETLDVEQCVKCSGLWFDSGEVAKLRKLSGVEGVIRAGAEPTKGDPPSPGSGPPSPGSGPPIMPAAALAAFTERLEEQRREAKGKAFEPKEAGEKASKFPEIPEGSTLHNTDERLSPTATHEGRTFLHFQTSKPVVTYVIGEFPWRVKVGEQAWARDFTCPPTLLSQELSGKESVWTQGEYLEPEEVWSAFKLQGSPPAKVGVAPAQPNPYHESFGGVLRLFCALGALAIFLAFTIGGRSLGLIAFEKSFSFDPKAVEKSVVTEVFDIGGHISNVEVTVDAQLNNQWAFLAMALINAETDVALDFSREVALYTGVDDEGQWREGSPKDEVTLPRVPPGRYYLRLEPETDTGSFNYAIKLRRDVARPSFAVIALILLALPMLWMWWRRGVFEQQRWMESDHPWGAGEDDEDDE